MTEAQLYGIWCEKATDPAMQSELESISGKDEEIFDRFYTPLSFGTAGLRGILGAGTNRMNIYTVGQATQGMANYVNAHYDNPCVAVAYDSRINSELFARHVACIFAANNIKVHIYKELMPTPALSFAVREYGCAAGVNITASHNPAQYNGYKAYDDTGSQLGLEAADEVLGYIGSIDLFSDVKTVNFDAAMADGRINYIPDSFVDKYINRVLEEQINPGICEGAGFKLVYSPLNGAGRRCVTTMLKAIGMTDITIVPEQEMPDGNFPTCPYPNPETLEALKLGLELYEKIDADLLLATDPDCDRVAAAVRQNGEPRVITGNEMGVLMLDYIARSKKETGKLPQNAVTIRSVVSTRLADRVAEHYGVEMIPVLTGFKFIGEQIRLLEEKDEGHRFIFAFEESYGYLTGGYVRDKDAVDGSLIICEMAAWYKRRGKTLADAIDDIYAQHGHYCDMVRSYTFKGADGMAEMASMMDQLRQSPPTEVAGYKVEYITDFLRSVTIRDGVETPICIASSNVLEFGLEGIGPAMVRPSGTEPKIKLYLSLRGQSKKQSTELANTIAAAMEQKMGVD